MTENKKGIIQFLAWALAMGTGIFIGIGGLDSSENCLIAAISLLAFACLLFITERQERERGISRHEITERKQELCTVQGIGSIHEIRLQVRGGIASLRDLANLRDDELEGVCKMLECVSVAKLRGWREQAREKLKASNTGDGKESP